MTIVTTESGLTYKMGRTWDGQKAKLPTVSLKEYLDYKTLPEPPKAVDYSVKAKPWLSQILDNDKLSDCTSAAVFHLAGMFLANAGEKIPFMLNDVIKFYSASCGYVPGNPRTDGGGSEEQVLDCWHQQGLISGQHKIIGRIAIDPSNKTEIMLALYWFENLYMGACLPDAWLRQAPERDGFVWDVAGYPVDRNGHAFCGVAYDANGIKVDSWGLLGTLTWRAAAYYLRWDCNGQLFAVLSPEIINKATQKAPNGLDIARLQADFKLI